MRVEATSASYLYTASLRATERVQKITANAAQETAAPQAVEDAPRAESSKQVDFTRMTQKEMRDWINEQLRDGKMTFEESVPLVVLSAFGTPLDAPESDLPYCNYMQMAREGLHFAQLGGNEYSTVLQKFWGSALSIMQRCQGQSASVDTFA